ncbi:hypothetical protein NEIMUCOT_04149 [Neisseria mucosa ATCC 25996]|uniref:Uncharacterized protein n=1 Tax=Neisseria mucosa (strain ATCC 25996 / DSM 4631 / NCTC 10774 / M26) TaxID=546266 RepID=D2ZU61_NEIM2|nr:hypothetical protein NEIMUCOT_04149 [Neisseria mucosa ATCC 25996]
MRNCNLVCRIAYTTYPNTFSVIPAPAVACPRVGGGGNDDNR